MRTYAVLLHMHSLASMTYMTAVAGPDEFCAHHQQRLCGDGAVH
jgi:hypothetical protein